MANKSRMSELAKARNVTVVLPTAPDPAPFRTWGNSVVVPIIARDDRVALIDALIAQVQGTAKAASDKPLLVIGVSGGAVLAYEYACDRSDAIDGVELVATEITSADLQACAPTQPIATLQVQGTADYVGCPSATYANSQAAFSKFLANNGCTETDVNHVSLPVPKGELITGIDVAYTSACSRGKDNAFVAIDGGGHSWPGLNRNFDILPIDLFGAVTNGFDATLQGSGLPEHLMNLLKDGKDAGGER